MFPFLSYFNFAWLFLLLEVVITVYILADSIKTHRNFILWPLAAFLTGGVVVLVLYLATRGQEDAEYNEEEDFVGQGFKRGYFFVFSFITLGILFFGIADFIRVILNYNWGGAAPTVARSYYSSYSSYSSDSFTRDVAFRLATIIVALPIWFFHWFHISENLSKITDSTELKITFRTYKSYLYLVMGINLAIIIVFGIWFVYQLLSFLLGATGIQLSSFAAPIGYTVVAAAVFGYHFYLLRGNDFAQVEQKVAALPSLKAAEPKAVKPKFCSKCGKENSASSSFCVNCGTKLA